MRWRTVSTAISVVALWALAGCGSGSKSSFHEPQNGFSNGNLKGTYTFFALGSDIDGPQPDAYDIGGVLVADGNGAITAGEQTYSNEGGSYHDNFTGSYSISSSGLGTVTLHTGDDSVGANGTETLSVVLLSASKGLIGEFDTSATSTGTLDLQTSTALPAGGYAFSVSGAGGPYHVLAFGGVFNIDNDTLGNISGAGSVCDMAAPQGNVWLDQTLSGSVLGPDSMGKVTIQLSAGFTDTPINFDGYIVDSSRIQLVENDQYAITGGTAIGQGAATGTFTTPAAFSGTFVYGFYGFNQSGYGADAGVITADGASNLTNGQIDQDQGGNVLSDTLTGTYSVDAAGTGRVVTNTNTNFGTNGTGPSLVFYLTGSGKPLPVLQAEATARSAGYAYLQSSGTPSFTGT
jgi:hypothetical protein